MAEQGPKTEAGVQLTDRELAYLRFVRWLYRQRRLTEFPHTAQGA